MRIRAERYFLLGLCLNKFQQLPSRSSHRLFVPVKHLQLRFVPFHARFPGGASVPDLPHSISRSERGVPVSEFIAILSFEVSWLLEMRNRLQPCYGGGVKLRPFAN